MTYKIEDAVLEMLKALRNDVAILRTEMHDPVSRPEALHAPGRVGSRQHDARHRRAVRKTAPAIDVYREDRARSAPTAASTRSMTRFATGHVAQPNGGPTQIGPIRWSRPSLVIFGAYTRRVSCAPDAMLRVGFVDDKTSYTGL